MKIDSNTIFLIVATLIIAAGAYWYFSANTLNEAPLSASVAANQAQTQFQILVSELPISFDTAIFSESRFMALVDLTTPVTPEAIGRLDPFASIADANVE